MATTTTTTPHTYVAGEDQGRLASAAQDLGLQRQEGRLPAKSWTNLIFNDDTLTSARMHSVGVVGSNERVDEYGTLHLMSLRQKKQQRVQQYEQLEDLFATPGSASASRDRLATTPSGDEDDIENDNNAEENEEEDEVIDMVEGGSLGAAAFGILKGTVGPAILYLPAGFYSSGWLVAVPAMLFATGMFVFNAYRLLECWRVESDKNHRVESRLKQVQALLQNNNANQYGATTVQQDHLFQAKLLTYPELAKRALGPYSLVVELGIALFQFGVCLTYLIFVPDNLHQCAKSILGAEQTAFTKTTFLWIMIAIEIPLAWIRDIRKLTPTNVLASFLILFGLCAVLVIAFVQGTETTIGDNGTEELVFVHNLKSLQPLTDSWFLFIGTSFFMMEGSITLLIPLQEAVYRPEDRRKFPDMNRDVTSWIVLFYVVFSVIACTAFGSSIQTALTASLEGSLATVVQLAYSVAVMLTFPLQAFPAMEVALRLMGVVEAGDLNGPKRNLFATVIVLVLGVVAWATIDYLGKVVSILGSLFGIPLALVFPPLMHNQLVKDSPASTKRTNYAVVGVGFFAMAAASYNTIATWDEGGAER